MEHSAPRVFLRRPDRLLYDLAFRRRHPKMDMAEVEGVLAEYDLDLFAAPQPLSGGNRSYSLLLQTSCGKRVLKRYIESLGQSTIIHEHSVLTYLAQGGLPSPRLVATSAGQTLVHQAQGRYALFLYVEGGFHYHQYVLLPGQTRRFIAIAGQTLARFHQALKDFSPLGFNPDGFRSQRGDRGRGVQWALDKLGRCLQTSSCQSPDADRDRVAQLLMEARSVQESLLRLDTALKQAALPRLVIHGDYGPYNLLFRKDAPVVVLDWEMARLGWRVTDLVYACFRFGCDTLGFRVSKVKWLLDAYQAHFPLTEDERRFLPAVWAFLNLWQCILNWDCYCETKAGSYLDKALWHLKAVDWMRANKDRLL